MELKKAMERKTNILQLVSMCLGAVLALSMVLLPANAAFAYDGMFDMSDRYMYDRQHPYMYDRQYPYMEEPGFPVDMEDREQACEKLAQTPPPDLKEDLQEVKQTLDKFCGPDAFYEGKLCEVFKQKYQVKFPDAMKYIQYNCEELEQMREEELKQMRCKKLKIQTNSFGFSKNQSCKDSKIADSVLSSSCRRSDGSYNNTSIDLNPYIENVDGRLMWQPGNFMETCRNTDLSCASVMTAECKTLDQRWIETYIDLDEHIANINGVFEYKY